MIKANKITVRDNAGRILGYVERTTTDEWVANSLIDGYSGPHPTKDDAENEIKDIHSAEIQRRVKRFDRLTLARV